MTISKEEIKKIASYLDEFGIKLWLEREINAQLSSYPKNDAKYDKASESSEIKLPTNQQHPTSKAGQDDPLETRQSEDITQQDIIKPIAKSIPKAIAKTIPKTIPRRIAAIAYEEVVIVYETSKNIGGINREEKQLLEKMLLKCGVNIEQAKGYTPEMVLAYPPFIENLERKIGEDQWLDVFAGFLMGILRKCPQHENCFIIVLGENSAAKLPYKESLIKFMNKSGRYKLNILVIEPLAAMLSEPTKRKTTWEILASLREHFSSQDAS